MPGYPYFRAIQSYASNPGGGSVSCPIPPAPSDAPAGESPVAALADIPRDGASQVFGNPSHAASSVLGRYRRPERGGGRQPVLRPDVDLLESVTRTFKKGRTVRPRDTKGRQALTPHDLPDCRPSDSHGEVMRPEQNLTPARIYMRVRTHTPTIEARGGGFNLSGSLRGIKMMLFGGFPCLTHSEPNSDESAKPRRRCIPVSVYSARGGLASVDLPRSIRGPSCLAT